MNPSKKKYMQSYRDSYATEFPYIKKSILGLSYAMCSICNADIRICYGGKSDIKKHVTSSKHQEKVKIMEKNKASSSITSYFSNSVDDMQKSVMTAELLFVNFLVEHNIPINAADHAGSLFRKMFPDSSIAKKFGCGRTKSSAVINVLASEKVKEITSQLQHIPFSVGIDGSNDTDSKLHPIIVSYFDRDQGKMESALLALNSIKDRSTGKNIAGAALDVFEKYSIPISNCVAFVADNAPVMLGERGGVVHFLKEKHEQLIPIRCSCHLINLAAQKAAAVLPTDIEQSVIDIYYYLEKSANRKISLKSFQNLHNTDIRKILKHVPTRWLSLNKCLQRLVEQWQPLLSFFLQEVKKCPVRSDKKQVNVKRKAEVKNVTSKKIKISENECSIKKESVKTSKNISDKSQHEQNSGKKSLSEKKIKNKNKYLTKEDRIFYFLSSEKNKAYCHFLLYVIPEFESKNVMLQSAAPQIHKLRDMFFEMLRNLLIKFVKPSVIKNAELLDIDFKHPDNQKEDADISTGSAAYKIVTQLKKDEQDEFYRKICQYYVAACSYIVQKFPLDNDVHVNADVANLCKIEMQSFSKIKFFVKKFPFLLNSSKSESDTEDDAWNRLQEQFNSLQVEDLGEILKEERADIQVEAIRKIKNCTGTSKYDALCNVLTAILTIPHSNADCERLFSVVKKNRSTFRSELSDKTLENLLIVKNKTASSCFNLSFSDELLLKAKSATFNQLNNYST